MRKRPGREQICDTKPNRALDPQSGPICRSIGSGEGRNVQVIRKGSNRFLGEHFAIDTEEHKVGQVPSWLQPSTRKQRGANSNTDPTLRLKATVKGAVSRTTSTLGLRKEGS